MVKKSTFFNVRFVLPRKYAAKKARCGATWEQICTVGIDAIEQLNAAKEKETQPPAKE